MTVRAAITGLGAVSGAGAGVPALWRLLCAGESVLQPAPALRAAGLDVGPVALLPEELVGAPFATAARAARAAMLAAEEALAEAGLPPLPPARLGVVVGTTLADKALWLDALDRGTGAAGDWTYGGPARAVAARAGAGQVEVVSLACASGNAALGLGLDLIRDGTCDAVLCGGVDVLCHFVVSGFQALKAHAPCPCRPFDGRRCGMNLGEGAAFLVLEAEERARARGRRVRAFLDGYGLAADANHMTGPDREGGGAARAMAAALAEAQVPPEAVDFVSLHGTATRYNDLMEAQALRRALGPRAREVPVNSIKGAIGHTLGAAGLLEAIMAVRALAEQLVPPTAGHEELDPEIALDVVAGRPRPARLGTVLSTSSGFGGLNAAVVLRQGDR